MWQPALRSKQIKIGVLFQAEWYVTKINPQHIWVWTAWSVQAGSFPKNFCSDISVQAFSPSLYLSCYEQFCCPVQNM